MTTRAELQALLARIEAASGTDREIDGSIYAVINRPEKPWFLGTQADEPETALFFDAAIPWANIPPYTSSLDAIVGLIERELPGWTWTADGGIGAHAEIMSNTGRFLIEGDIERYATASTVPLALCEVFIRAKLAMLEASDAG